MDEQMHRRKKVRTKTGIEDKLRGRDTVQDRRLQCQTL